MISRDNKSAVPTLAAAAALAAVMCAAGPAGAQDKIFELKLSHWVPPSHPLQKAIEEWGAAVEKESGGTIHYKVYPSEQLGKAFDHYDMVRDGIADLGYVSPGYQPGRFPVIDAAALPFIVGKAHGGTTAIDSWYRKYAPAEMKDVKFCFAFMHDPGTFHSRTKKIEVPTDLKGMKIRPAHATMAAFVTLMGGTNVQASAPEVRDVMEKGVADAVTFPWGSIVLFGIDKATKYHMEASLYTTPFVWVMNKAKYDEMSAMQKKAIDDNCTSEAAEKFAGPWADFEHAGIAKIKALPDHEVYKISDAQLGEWRKASEPLVGQWIGNAKKSGVDGDAALKELQNLIAQNNAGM